jgi:hypothetical protein
MAVAGIVATVFVGAIIFLIKFLAVMFREAKIVWRPQMAWIWRLEFEEPQTSRTRSSAQVGASEVPPVVWRRAHTSA